MNEIILIILKTLYFMFPAYIATLVPVFVREFNFLNKPVDFGKKLGGKPIFGAHKTWRGLFFGTFGGMLAANLQFVLSKNYAFFANISLVDYSVWIIYGFLIGFGALFGDLVRSFFKRRMNIKPGGKFIPWDELDYTIGSLLLVSIVYIPSWQIILAAFAVNFILHVLVNHLSYYLKITDVRW